jgi:sec-independent protein translocase protein TatA
MRHLFGPEGIIVLLIVLVLFGGKKIPEFAKGLGKGIREFKGAVNGESAEGDAKTLKKSENPDENNPKV